MNPQAAPTRPTGGDRNFRWLMSGACISMLGDQFTLVALPWLVLKMTGDPLVLGTVLAVISVPRALFLLVGGAFVDRYSPKRVMMLTKHVNTVLLGVLAALVAAGGLSLWMVYALAAGIGVATAFSIPAGTSMLPHVVPPERLQSANGLMMSLRQLTFFIGPLLAGALIALFGDAATGTVSDAGGLALAFAFDAASYAISAWTLAKVRTREPAAASATAPPRPVLADVAEGLRACWQDRELRTCFLYWSVVALLVTGPVQVAMPVLASTQLGVGAGGFGLLMGAHGAGTLAGMALSAARPTLRAGNLGQTLLLVDALAGLLFVPMAFVDSSWQAITLLLAIGLLGGFIQVSVFTWIQRRVTRHMLGRTMSLFMFIFMGLAPLAGAATSWLLRSVPAAQVFAGMGVALLVIVALALVASPMPRVHDAAPLPPG
jgi:MFS family permease